MSKGAGRGVQTILEAAGCHSHVGAHPGLAVGWSQLPLAPFSGRGLQWTGGSSARGCTGAACSLMPPAAHLDVDLVAQHSCPQDHGLGAPLELLPHQQRLLEGGAALIHIPSVQDLCRDRFSRADRRPAGTLRPSARGHLAVRVDAGVDESLQDELRELVLQRRHRGVEGCGHLVHVSRHVGAEVLWGREHQLPATPGHAQPTSPAHAYLDERAVADLGVQSSDVGRQVHVQEQVVLQREAGWGP